MHVYHKEFCIKLVIWKSLEAFGLRNACHRHLPQVIKWEDHGRLVGTAESLPDISSQGIGDRRAEPPIPATQVEAHLHSTPAEVFPENYDGLERRTRQLGHWGPR